MAEQLCPVCQGHGIVPAGFYTHPAGQSGYATTTSPECCRRCRGLGTIPDPAVALSDTRVVQTGERNEGPDDPPFPPFEAEDDDDA